MEKEQIIKIAVPAGKKAEWVDGFLKLVDNEEAKEKKPVTERVKTFDDACKELGIDAEAIQQQWQDAGITMLDEVAYQKLRIITAALNEGWEPEFKEDEYRYYPYCILYTKAEIEQKDDEWKDEYNLQLWFGGGSSYIGAYCGLASAASFLAWSFAAASFSARLAHKTEELAIYSGKQFTELWANYYTGKEVQSWRNS
ncbi:MAG: hypothetical protein [Bacteriophage sp.]|nr:MAG: hypothetical protein [Bacteriophage sp.]